MSDDSDDFFLEDLGGEKPKRKNSGRKGKSGERNLCQILSARFPDREEFSRVIGSGAHWRAGLAEAAKQVMVGDLVCPAGFRFAIESKFGYEGIDLAAAISAGNRQIDDFLEQVSKDAVRSGREPLLCWRKPRQQWIAFGKFDFPSTTYEFKYREWRGVALTELLKQPDNYFFKHSV